MYLGKVKQCPLHEILSVSNLEAFEHVSGAALSAAAPRAVALARLDGDRVHLTDHRVLDELKNAYNFRRHGRQMFIEC